MLSYVQRIIFLIEIFFGQATYEGGQGQDLGVGTSEVLSSCHGKLWQAIWPQSSNYDV